MQLRKEGKFRRCARVYLKSRKYRLFLQTQPDFALKSLGQYRIILSADTASEVRQMLSQSADNTGCLIEHFGNADAVPQPPKRCLSRKAGIVRCCLRYYHRIRTRMAASMPLSCAVRPASTLPVTSSMV